MRCQGSPLARAAVTASTSCRSLRARSAVARSRGGTPRLSVRPLRQARSSGRVSTRATPQLGRCLRAQRSLHSPRECRLAAAEASRQGMIGAPGTSRPANRVPWTSAATGTSLHRARASTVTLSLMPWPRAAQSRSKARAAKRVRLVLMAVDRTTNRDGRIDRHVLQAGRGRCGAPRRASDTVSPSQLGLGLAGDYSSARGSAGEGRQRSGCQEDSLRRLRRGRRTGARLQRSREG